MKTTGFLLLVLVATGDPARYFTQQSTEPVAVTFRRLQSAAEVDKAAAQLLRQGRSDPKAREYIALHLPSLIEKGPTQKDHPGPWVAVVRLAGQLKIAEAAPALAKWLTIDNIGEMTTAG